MASGSRTVSARTKTETKTASEATATGTPRPPPPRSDFERDFRKQVKQDSRAQKEKDAQAEWRRLRKEYRDRGEEIPKELKKAPAKASSSAGGRGKGKGKAVMKDDEAAVVAAAREERRARKDGGKKTRKRREDSGSGSSSEGEKPTRPTLNLGAKKTEVEKRTGIALLKAANTYGSEEGGEADVLAEHNDYSDDEDTIRKHLARRWVNRKHPERMTAQRKALELKYNPLIRLLDCKIVVVEGGKDDERSGSDDGDGRFDDTHVAVHTDTEASYSSDDHPDTDWGTDGMGEFNGMVKTPPPAFGSDASTSRGFGGLMTDDEEDRKLGFVSTTPLGSPSKPPLKLESSVDRKPVIVLSSDSEEPPTDEDEDPATTSAAPRPSFAAPPSRSAAATAVFAPRSAVKKEDEDVDMTPSHAHDSDSGAEPDTDDGEPDTEDDEEIAAPPASAHPHFPSHHHLGGGEPSSSQTAGGGSQLFSSVKAESQSQLSQHFSQSQSKGKGKAVAVKPDPDAMDLDEDDEDSAAGSDVIVYRTAGVLRRKKEDAEQRRRLEKQREMERQIAEERARKERVKLEEGVESEREEEEDNDEDGADVPAWKLHEVSSNEPAYPRPVKKGRPKFLLADARQAKIGPHILARDPTDPAQIPAPINKFLRPYQREGAEFLYKQFGEGTGGILGDDMGLGKTIQVIAFLSAVMGKTGYKKDDFGRRKSAINARDEDADTLLPSDLGATALIICPASVVHNWEREFQTWGYFDVAIYAGGTKEKRACLKRFDLGYVDVVIGSFEAVRNGIDDLARHDFSIIICDEAHRVKNPKSRTTTALHQFPSKLRYGLTGTAVQNRLSEFWCILNWVAPGKVGTHSQWNDLLTRPLKYAQKVDATDDELALGRQRAQALVTSLLPNFWLRRTKDSVKLQLPKKTDNVVLCPLTPLQKDVYRRLLQLPDVQIMLTADDPCPCGEKDAQGLPYKRGSCCEQQWTKLIFKYITLFQKVSNHLGLIYPDKEDKEKNLEKYEQDLEWARAAFPDDHHKRKPGATAFLDPELCGKWTILCELLEHWSDQGDKVLIFSMSLKVIDLLKDLMETTRYKYLSLDGSTPQDDRMPLVDEFNDPESDVFCFLISTRAGGVGLNLTAANRVVIFDPNWNPAHDLQAMDRAYRFGQRRDVHVYRLIGAGTLEELIYNRQQYKRAIAAQAYDASAERRFYSGVEGEGKEEQGELWGVRNIFRFSENISLTEKSIQRANLAELEYALQNAILFEAEDGKVADLPDQDPDEVVAEVTGYSRKGAAQAMTAEERAAQEKHLAEQEKIARILGGTLKVESNATLGGSSLETMRAKGAVKNHLTGGKPSPRQSSTSTHTAAKGASAKGKPAPSRTAGIKREHPASESEDVYDPLARGRGKRKAPSPPKKSSTPAPSTSSSSRAKGDSLFSSFGLPTGVGAMEVLAANGYDGNAGLAKFLGEIEGVKGSELGGLLRRVVGRWKEKEGLKEE
ncbi:hypothetical protein JCM10213_006729 [Rhodosporidiobolus nylandii]